MDTTQSHDWLTALAAESLGDFALSPDLDRELSRLALLARDDPEARDTLFRQLAYKINRFCSRFRRWNLRPWEIDDVRQETYLAFVDVVNGWRPVPTGASTGFSYYFMRVYPLRLTDRVRRILRFQRGRPAAASWVAEHDRRQDPDRMEEQIEALMEIIDLSSRLSAADARLVLLRSADELTGEEIAAQIGISRRTFQRRWRGIAATIRREAG